MDSELTQLEKAAALIAVATVTMGVAGDKIATFVENDKAFLPVLAAIRDCLDVMGAVSDQVTELLQQHQSEVRPENPWMFGEVG